MRPHLETPDRLFWIALAQLWRNWRSAGGRPTGHRRAVAPPMAPTAMDVALQMDTSGAA